MTLRIIAAAAMLSGFTACEIGSADTADVASDDRCEVPSIQGRLPAEIPEASGLATGIADPEVLWTHNDSGGEAAVYAVDVQGRLLGTVRVDGAKNRDWEDIDAAPCDGGSCLYIADIGDNDENRPDIDVYRLREPTPNAGSVTAERLRMRYPDGKHNAEALFAMPNGDLYIVTKSRTAPAAVYRYPAASPRDRVVTLELVQTLGDAPPPLPLDVVTGAGASPNGRFIAIRTYAAVQLYEQKGERFEALLSSPVPLSRLRERQGEAVDVLDDGTVLLASEGGKGDKGAGTMGLMRCSLQ